MKVLNFVIYFLIFVSTYVFGGNTGWKNVHFKYIYIKSNNDFFLTTVYKV